MINHIRFCKYFCDKYHNKYYPRLSDDIIADIVDVTLNRAPDSFFTWDMVQQYGDFCKQCGACCATIDCRYFNGRTCDEYATRFDACVEFPFFEINGETGLILDPGCQFALKLAEMVLDNEFEKNLDLLEVD
jgi:hypothetical protein